MHYSDLHYSHYKTL